MIKRKSITCFKFLTVFLLLFAACDQKPQQPRHLQLIEQGEFSKAKQLIETRLESDETLTAEERQKLLFEIERMERIKKDFTKTEADLVEFIEKYIPDVNREQLREWEETRALESMMIDGEKRYFNYAARNLFRIDPECKEIWKKHHSEVTPGSGEIAEFDLKSHDRKIMELCRLTGKKYANPVRMQIKYTITVDENAVPAAETVRCWIPFPREIPGRQTNIELIATNPQKHQLAGNQVLQRTIYFEQPAVQDHPPTFSVEYEYTSYGMYVDIDPEKVEPVGNEAWLEPYLKETPPHIVFTDELKQLSAKIVGDETNPYKIAQKLFEWVDVNIPWASAREYASIRNLSMYPYINRHGDCGIQTLMFITLCRINGIPARWQSGWEFQPPDDSMHDWGMIYFKPYGWAPMDVTYGLFDDEDPALRWFYLSGMDSYRLIFNDAWGQPFEPPKQHFRSETVDSQRGEVEWDGGNLYFDQWDWDIEWKEVVEKEQTES